MRVTTKRLGRALRCSDPGNSCRTLSNHSGRPDPPPLSTASVSTIPVAEYGARQPTRLHSKWAGAGRYGSTITHMPPTRFTTRLSSVHCVPGRVGVVRLVAAATRDLALKLDRWARNGAIRTENTTIAGLGPQERAAAGAVIEIHAGVGRHGLGLHEPAMRASKRRLELGVAFSHRNGPIIPELSPIRGEVIAHPLFTTALSEPFSRYLGRHRKNDPESNTEQIEARLRGTTFHQLISRFSEGLSNYGRKLSLRLRRHGRTNERSLIAPFAR